MPTRQTSTAEKITDLSLTEIGGLFHAKRLSERHIKLLRRLKLQFGKPTKSVKNARMAWKDKEENFSDELLRMREE